MKPAVPGTATSPSTVTNKPVINKSITKYINSLTTKSVSILATTTENDEVADCDGPTVSSTNPPGTGIFVYNSGGYDRYTVCPGISDPFYIVCQLYKMGHYFLDTQ